MIGAGFACLLALAAPGGPAAGRAIFAGKGGCLNCHAVENQGGSLGPDLSEVGVTRTLETLRAALLDPDAEIEAEYLTISLVTKRGERVQGIRLNEDDFSIQLRDTNGNLRSFQKDGLETLGRELRSLMPSYAATLSTGEIDDLVAYLGSLRGAVVRPGGTAGRTRTIAPVSERVDWLTRPERDGEERPEAVLDALQIPGGATVADVGAGAGYFTWRLARRVGPGGKVIAVEVQQRMLDLIADDLKQRRATNVELVLGEERNPRLPEGGLDLVLLANAYHEFSEPEIMMAAIRRSLKPRGRVAVLEYRKEDNYSPVEGLHQMSLRELRSEWESMGFETEQVLRLLPRQHLVIFRSRP
jgi:putative heme-binding domain-containing protein